MTLYERLGVEADASAEVIKERYRALAKALHPDLHEGGDGEERVAQMAAINEAYHVLADPQLRAAYDHQLAVEKLHAEEEEVGAAPYQPPSSSRLMKALVALTLLALISLIALNRRSPNQRRFSQELKVVKPLLEPRLEGALKRGDLPSLEEGLNDPRGAMLKEALIAPSANEPLTVERCLERFPGALRLK